MPHRDDFHRDSEPINSRSVASASTVLADFYRSSALDSALSENSYKGLRIHALPGLHEYVGQLIVAYRGRLTDVSAYDFGAGSGAMSMRLHDLGFRVLAVDYVRENFQVDRGCIPLLECDLNQEFSVSIGEGADLVTAVEIIEHLENPRNFLRECARLLKPKGLFILTTPNIDCSYSRAKFIGHGVFNMFDDSSYRTSGHMTPISSWQLYKIIDEVGLQVIAHRTFGSDTFSLKDWPRMAIFQRFLRAVGKKFEWGDGLVHVVALSRP